MRFAGKKKRLVGCSKCVSGLSAVTRFLLSLYLLIVYSVVACLDDLLCLTKGFKLEHFLFVLQ